MDISVIIVNYKTPQEVKNCVESVLQQKNVNFEIIVVDNDSQDKSVEVLENFGGQLKLIKNSENIGFGRANNLAAHQALGKYILLLNPDAWLQYPNDLEKMVKFMENNKQFGLVGTKIVNKCGRETRPNKFYPGERYIGYPYKNLPGAIAWVLGACMIIPKKIYEKIAGFDEDYFLYGEDPDICLRIRKLGYEIGYFFDVAITHIGAVTERETSWYDRTIRKQKGLLLFYQKHYTPSAVRTLVRHDLKQAQRKITLNYLRTVISFGLLRRAKDAKQKAIYDFTKEL